MAITAAKLQVEVDADTRDFQQGMNKADQQLDGFQKSTGETGGAVERMGGKFSSVVKGAIIGVGIEGVRRFATASFNAAADLNESMNAVQVVFGDSADKILDFSDTAIDSVGLAETKVNQAATVLGSSLQAAGLEADAAADQTINLTERAADMASVFNTDVETALQAIQSAIRGETDPIEKFGVSMSAASVQAFALAEGLHDGAGEMDNQTKVLARLGVIMDQTERVAGDYENTQDSAANATKRFRERLSEMQAEIGQELIPVVEELVPLLEDMLPAVAGLAKGFGDLAREVKPFVKVSADLTGELFNTSDATDVLSDALGSATDRLVPGFDAARDLVGALIDLGDATDDETTAAKDAADAAREQTIGIQAMAQTSKGQAEPAVRSLASAFNTARLDADGMKSAIDRLIGREIDAAEATLRFESDLASLVEELKEGARTFDVKTEAGRANQKQLLATIGTTKDMITASVQEARTVTEARDAVAGHIEQLRESMRQGGLTEQQISELIEQYNLVPDEILTHLSMRTNADEVFARVRRQANALRREGFTVTQGGGPLEFHEGGWVPGSSASEVPAILQGGEFVVSHDMMRRGGGPVGPQTIVIPISFAGREFDEIVVEGQRARSRRGQVSAVVR